MRETHRRSVLAAGGTLLAGVAGGKWLRRRAEAAEMASSHPPVQPFSTVRAHAPAPLPPGLAVLDADNRPVPLSDLLGHGAVLTLWATWCVPCVAEMPSLDALSRTLAPDGIRVLPVSLDHGGAAQVAPFYAAHAIRSLPVLLDPHGSILSALGLEGIPMTLLIDRRGREVGRVQGSVDWADPAAVPFLRTLLG